MNHKILITIVSLLIVILGIGGVVYREWQEKSVVGTILEPSPAEAIAGVASATPIIIAVNEPTDVTVTIELTDSRLIPNSVNLQRLDANGKVIAVLGNLNDAGANGDAAANDKIFSIRKSFTEVTPTPVQLRVSWGLKGVLKRAVSNTVTVEVWRRAEVISNGVTVGFAYPSRWSLSSNGTGFFVYNPANSNPEDEFIPPDLSIRVTENPDLLPLHNFIPSLSDGWYVRNYDLSELTVDGHRAILASSLRGQVPATPALAVFINVGSSIVVILARESSQEEFFDVLKFLNLP